MNFEEAEKKFRELKVQFEAGTLTEAEFKKRLEELMVEDEQGNWWMIGYKSELWYRYDGTNWVQTDPPRGSLTRSSPMRASETKSAAGQPSFRLPRSILAWSIIGLVGCLFLLTSIWGVSSFLSSLGDKTQTPTATEPATPTFTQVPPSPTEARTSTPTRVPSNGNFSKTGFSFTFGRSGVKPGCIVVDPGTAFSEPDFADDKWLYFSTKYSDDEIGNSFFWSVLAPDGSVYYGDNERVLEKTDDSCFWQGFSLTTSPTTGVYELVVEYKSEIIYRLTFSVE